MPCDDGDDVVASFDLQPVQDRNPLEQLVVFVGMGISGFLMGVFLTVALTGLC